MAFTLSDKELQEVPARLWEPPLCVPVIEPILHRAPPCILGPMLNSGRLFFQYRRGVQKKAYSTVEADSESPTFSSTMRGE